MRLIIFTNGLWTVVSKPGFFDFTQARELQTLHNLRRLFVQDLATRIKKVKRLGSVGHYHCNPHPVIWFCVWYNLQFCEISPDKAAYLQWEKQIHISLMRHLHSI